jgi:hypothetical protein
MKRTKRRQGGKRKHHKKRRTSKAGLIKKTANSLKRVSFQAARLAARLTKAAAKVPGGIYHDSKKVAKFTLSKASKLKLGGRRRKSHKRKHKRKTKRKTKRHRRKH